VVGVLVDRPCDDGLYCGHDEQMVSGRAAGKRSLHDESRRAITKPVCMERRCTLRFWTAETAGVTATAGKRSVR